MKTGINVYDAMTTKPIYVSPEISLKDCGKIMSEERVGCVLVKEKGDLVGILTERDIVSKCIANNLVPSENIVKDFMVTDIKTIDPKLDIFDAINKMKDMDIRRLPVLDNGKFIGLLTLKDILKVEPQLFELMIEKIKLREEERKPIHKNFEESDGLCSTCGEYYTDLIQNKHGLLVCTECLK